jgi:hypothetical protein
MRILWQEVYRGFGPTLASEYLANKHSLRFGREALRQLMLSQGLWWVRRPAKVEVHQWRPRRGSAGELVQVLFAPGRGVAPWMASVTFGGPDLRTAYIGSLQGPRIPYFQAPVPGLPMGHWNER